MIEGKPFRQADRILKELLVLPASERAGVLSRRARGDPRLKVLLERLLARATADDPQLRPGAGLELPGVETDDFAPHPVSPLAPGDRVGPFRLLRVLGRGGMATVYLAERADGQFEQTAALKVLERTGETLARFEQERQILASLDHPNTARLLDGGVAGRGVPWVAMEYVAGEPLLEYCDRRRLGVEERLRLFGGVIDAVHDAHRKLIIHRDIKSANILVTPDGVPKLLDFGIAKLLSADALPNAAPHTRLLTPMTPEYASPEQVRNETLSVATDIYQLGYLLYVLLTGRSPYAVDHLDVVALVEAITGCDPVAPSRRVSELPSAAQEPLDTPWGRRSTTRTRLGRRLRGDLDRVVLKAMHKDPDRRYAGAAALAADIDNVLLGRPISARPDSVAYRTQKLFQRHPVAVSATAVGIVVAVIGTSLFTHSLAREKEKATLAAARAETERAHARAETAKSEQVVDFLTTLFLSSDPRQGEEPTVRDVVDRGARRIAGDLSGQPVVQAELMNVLGRIYLELGDFDRAGEFLAGGLALRREHLGEHPDVAESLRNLGLLRYERADYERAERLYAEAVELLESTAGPDAAQLAPVLNNLGLLYKRTGDFDKAVAAYERALAINESHFGATADEVGKVANNLGNSLLEMGEERGALEAYERALAIYQRSRGLDSPLTAGTLTNIGIARLRLGEYEGLEDIFQRTLTIHRKAYGPVHTNVANALWSLARYFAATDRFDEAVDTYQQAADIYRQALGPDHPYVASPLYRIGDLNLAAGNPAEAADYFRRAAALREAAFGSEHPLLANCLEGLGRALMDVDDRDGAEATLRRAVAIRRLHLDDDPESLAESLGYLGTVLADSDRCDQALPVLREAEAIVGDTDDVEDEILARIGRAMAACPAPQ